MQLVIVIRQLLTLSILSIFTIYWRLERAMIAEIVRPQVNLSLSLLSLTMKLCYTLTHLRNMICG